MALLSPPLIQRISLAIALLWLASNETVDAGAEPKALEWSISSPSFEAAPKSFPAIAVHLHNRTPWLANVRIHFELGAPLRALDGSDLTVELPAGAERTKLYTLYIPPDAPGGREIRVRAEAQDGSVSVTSVRIKAAAGGKATSASVGTKFLHPGEKASYQVKVANTGNVPLHCTLVATTSPKAGPTTISPGNLVVPVGGNAAATVEVETKDVAEFTPFVTVAEIKTAELSGDAGRQFLYFHTEAFPKPAPADRATLFEPLKGSLTIATGSGSGNDGNRRGAEGIAREELTLEGLVTENTRLQLIESFTHPAQGQGNESSALSALPSGNRRNFFHLGFYNPYFDLEGGEITTAPPTLLSSRETGDGVRAAVRPTGTEKIQVEAFAERNSLTLNRKDVFGATASGVVQNSPLEFWRVGILSKRGDIGPQGRDWDAIGVDTGWKIPLALPLRAEVSAAAGKNGEGKTGVAWKAGFHYNRTVRGESDTSPVKAGIELASGDKEFPGQQNGREDRRAYLTFRVSAEPVFVEVYANYDESKYKVVPNIERTLEEEQNLVPDFLLTSQSRLINAGVRWKRLIDTPGQWHLPAGNLEYQETSYFSRSNFFDRANERAGALNLQPFESAAALAGTTPWSFNLLARGGTETHELSAAPKTDSRFFTLGTDFNISGPAPAFLEKIGGPGRVTADFSGRYTVNFDNDKQALNRTGLSATATASWQSEVFAARIGATVYSYVDQGMSDRIWASFTRKVGKDWWAGIEAAYTHRGGLGGSRGAPDETAILLTVRHDFEVPVPWLPRQGQAVGQVYNDLNNNGRRDTKEPGLEGVKVAVGSKQALTGKDGEFSLPPMGDAIYPIDITPPDEVHYNESADHPMKTAVLTKGAITQLDIGLLKPTSCEGKVRFVRERAEGEIASDDSPDLSGLEIVATDAEGRRQRSAARADGFFTLYLESGAYEIRVNPETLKAQQVVSPTSLRLKVEHAQIENLAFTVTERAKRIRKTFSAKNP